MSVPSGLSWVPTGRLTVPTGRFAIPTSHYSLATGHLSTATHRFCVATNHLFIATHHSCYPQAGWTLTFSIDEKVSKKSSQTYPGLYPQIHLISRLLWLAIALKKSSYKRQSANKSKYHS